MRTKKTSSPLRQSLYDIDKIIAVLYSRCFLPLQCTSDIPYITPDPCFQTFEKVLVQNLHFGLSPSLTEAISMIPRWRFILACLPHVMQCAAAMLQHR